MNKLAFLTMDVESYFDTSCLKNKKIEIDQKYNCAEEILNYANFLSKHNIKGTFFVTVDFIKYSKDYLLEAIKQGHEIALHCLTHHSYKKYDKESFRKELIESKRIILEELGVEPVGFRFPRWEYKKELFDVLLEEGFIYDSSVIRPNRSFKKVHGYVYIRNGLFEYAPNIWKFPFKTVLLSGGGFYRFLKGTSMSKVLRKHINNHDTFMIYFHPFEIHKGYLPMPKRGLLSVQKKYLQKNREVYLDSIEQMISYLKEQGYTFSNMKEYALAKQKEYK